MLLTVRLETFLKEIVLEETEKGTVNPDVELMASVLDMLSLRKSLKNFMLILF